MVSINKSFLYGIFFASITWTVSLYLYWQLNKNDLSLNSTTSPLLQSRDKKIRDDNVINRHKWWNLDIKDKHTGYVNSQKNIAQLRSVNKHANDSDSALSELGLVKTEEEQKIRDEGYKRHAFNVLISNKLSYHRSIPDTRNKLCQAINYPEDLPTASIIICFYNEHYPTLLRTIHSVIDRTPSALLEEIILVDDYSDIPELHSNLMEYIEKHLDSRIKLFKTERREGLIRARMFGARKARGDVLLFLDSHVEVNVNWSQPLLAEIKKDRKNVVMPVIDIINADTFAYTASPLVRGGFNWGLHFKWENLPKGTLSKDEDFVKPIKSPTMAGGLFAMDRRYFVALGEYDPGMDIWGGENIEISFRIWMCGGSLALIPCSRVGHVFRKARPYGSPDGKDTMLRNSLRVAYVWMDNYKEHFLKQLPRAAQMKFGDISARVQLRKDLNCKDFDWYLKNVYPEMVLPSDDEKRLKSKWAALEQDKYQPWHLRKRNYVDQYQIRLANTTLCVQSEKDVKTKRGGLILKNCLRKKQQMWYETDKKELVLAQLLCLQAGKQSPYLYKCHELGGDQEWKHKGTNKTPIYNLASGQCLGVENRKAGTEIVMKLCTEIDKTTWDLVR